MLSSKLMGFPGQLWGVVRRQMVQAERLTCMTFSSLASSSADLASPAVCTLDGPYIKPIMKTAVPGPRSKEILQKMGKITESRVALSCVDFEKSQGNFVVDADGNIMLDVFCQIASLPLGYNHPAIVEATTRKENLVYLINRPATPFQPPVEIVEMLQTSLLKCAPVGMSQVTTMGCGSCANENAIKAALIRYQDRQRGFRLPDEDSEEFKTALWNKVTMISQIMSSGHGIKTYYKPTPYLYLMWNLI